jgi:RNA polymerase sigma-70 factor (ECF subfamily)
LSDILEHKIKSLCEQGKLEKAFNLLVDSFQERLYWQVRNMVKTHDNSNDVVQNVMIKIWKGLSNFRWDSKLNSWMFRIAYNESITFINKEKKQIESNGGDYLEYLSQSLESDVYYDGNEMERKFQLAIASLPEKQKQVFHLKYYEDKKYEEISALIGGSVGGLKANYHHAVKKIKEFIDQH